MNSVLRKGIFVTVLASSASFAGEQPEGPPPTPVTVAQAESREMAEMLLVPGTVISRNDAQVSAEISGRLSWVAEVGDLIREGEAIARIDDTLLQLQISDNRSQVNRLSANIDYLQSQVDRFTALAASNGAARQQLDEAHNQLTMAHEDLNQARNALARTQYQLDRAVVAAPFSGRVVDRVSNPGEFIQPGGTLVRLVDTTNLEIQAQAPLDVARFLTAGLPVRVSDRDGFVSSAENRIRTVVPVGDARSRMMEVRIELDDPRWVVGSALRIALPRSEVRTVLAVHRDALILRQDSMFVYRVNSDSTVERVPVSTGIGDGALIEIRGELQDGDDIVIRGNERLQPGQAVAVQES
jgi:RND family efflux transporter MFP subunit